MNINEIPFGIQGPLEPSLYCKWNAEISKLKAGGDVHFIITEVSRRGKEKNGSGLSGGGVKVAVTMTIAVAMLVMVLNMAPDYSRISMSIQFFIVNQNHLPSSPFVPVIESNLYTDLNTINLIIKIKYNIFTCL